MVDQQPNIQQLISQFLPYFQGQVHAQRKPEYKESKPVWSDDMIIAKTEQGDVRRWTQVKLWLKPPSFSYPNSTAFLSFVNGKGAVYTKITVDDLKAIAQWIQLSIPILEEKLNSLKELEATQAAAKAAYDAMVDQGAESPDSMEQ